MSKAIRKRKPRIGAELAKLLLEIPSGRRPAVLSSVASFIPEVSLEQCFRVGEVRSGFAKLWEQRLGEPIPLAELRAVLRPPQEIRIVTEFGKLALEDKVAGIQASLIELVDFLAALVNQRREDPPLPLFDDGSVRAAVDGGRLEVGQSVGSLYELIEQGKRFPSIYADPPWRYRNKSSRGAAENHYPTMSLDEICAEPVSELAAENAHLHLWTTNSFLREAFEVIDAWGFEYKSCFVWVKRQIGLGNYWRVSHEYLMLGVRGKLRFQDRSQASWIGADRTRHSRKPAVVRSLIEKVSPGPYLEMYGRDELPNSAWTVYGNELNTSEVIC